MKYGELNLGQVEAVVNKLGGMDGVHKLLSGELTVKEVKCQRQTFKVLVNYSQTLKEMIKTGKYDWVNNDITSDHFSIKGSGQKEKEITLFHFIRGASSISAITEMTKAGYRPVLIEELLALGAEHKELQKQFPIVALGFVWQNPHGRRYVPALRWDGVQRGLYLYSFEYVWDEYWRFAAVRK